MRGRPERGESVVPMYEPWGLPGCNARPKSPNSSSAPASNHPPPRKEPAGPAELRAPDVEAALTVLGRGRFADPDPEAPQLDLSDTDLRRAYLSRADLRRARFDDTDLRGVRLDGADLPGR